jgi:hypothetical protein
MPPLYEFQCVTCGQITEALCKLGDKVPPLDCNHDTAELIISAPHGYVLGSTTPTKQ